MCVLFVARVKFTCVIPNAIRQQHLLHLCVAHFFLLFFLNTDSLFSLSTEIKYTRDFCCFFLLQIHFCRKISCLKSKLFIFLVFYGCTKYTLRAKKREKLYKHCDEFRSVNMGSMVMFYIPTISGELWL